MMRHAVDPVDDGIDRSPRFILKSAPDEHSIAWIIAVQGKA